MNYLIDKNVKLLASYVKRVDIFRMKKCITMTTGVELGLIFWPFDHC